MRVDNFAVLWHRVCALLGHNEWCFNHDALEIEKHLPAKIGTLEEHAKRSVCAGEPIELVICDLKRRPIPDVPRLYIWR